MPWRMLEELRGRGSRRQRAVQAMTAAHQPRGFGAQRPDSPTTSPRTGTSSATSKSSSCARASPPSAAARRAAREPRRRHRHRQNGRPVRRGESYCKPRLPPGAIGIFRFLPEVLRLGAPGASTRSHLGSCGYWPFRRRELARTRCRVAADLTADGARAASSVGEKGVGVDPRARQSLLDVGPAAYRAVLQGKSSLTNLKWLIVVNRSRT